MATTAANAQINVTANTTAAETSLKVLQAQLKSLQYANKDLGTFLPGGQTSLEIVKRLTGGVMQLIQGLSASAFRGIADTFTSVASAGYETTASLETINVAFNTLLQSEEEAAALTKQIAKDALRTPFDVTGLASATQKLALITKNGKEAETTILNLGKAVISAGGGDEQLSNLSSYLQQIGINAKVTQRQLSAFGTAGVNIIEMVYNSFGEQYGLTLDTTKEWLQSIKNPYDVIVQAINDAGSEAGQFADVYEDMTNTIEQRTANLQDAIGLFGESVLTQSGVVDKIKDSMKALTDVLTDPLDSGGTLIGTVSTSLKKLTKDINVVEIVKNAINGLNKVLGAFNAGQFDNMIVFFKQLFGVLKSFSGISVVGKIIKYILDLFSNNHTAQEVRKVATQFANLLKIILTFKLINRIAGYFTTFAKIVSSALASTTTFIFALAAAIGALTGVFGDFSSTIDGLFGGISDVVATTGSKVADEAKESGKNITSSLGDGIESGTDSATSKMSDAYEKLAQMQADWVKEMGDMGAFDLSEQIDQYRYFASLYASGTKARLELDQKVHDAEISISKEIISLAEEYNKAFEKSYDTAHDFYDLFEYTQSTLSRSAQSVITGLERQNANLAKYRDNLLAISKMGFDSDLLNYIYEQGVDAAGEVAGLAEATEEEINRLNELWRERGTISTDIAKNNTKELKDETLSQIEQLQQKLSTQVVDVYDSGTLLVTTFTEGIYDMLPTLQDALAEIATTASDTIGSSINTSGIDVDWDDYSDEYEGLLDQLSIDTFKFGDLTTMVLSFIKDNLGIVLAGFGVFGYQYYSKMKDVFGKSKQVTEETASAIGESLKKIAKNTSSNTNQMSQTLIQSYGDISDRTKKHYANQLAQQKQAHDLEMQNIGNQNAEKLAKTNNYFGRLQNIIKNVSDTISTLLSSIVNTVVDTVMKVVRNILNWANKLAKSLMNILKTIGKGIGEAIKALLTPLSNPKLLIGAAVITALAAAVWLLADAVKKVAEAIGIFIQDLGLLAVTLVEVSKAGREIDYGGLLGFGAAIAELGAIFTATLVTNIIGCVSSLFGAGMAASMIVIASDLSAASKYAGQIDDEALANVASSLYTIGSTLTEGLVSNIIGAISGFAGAAVATEMVGISWGLADASKHAKNIDADALVNVSDAITTIGRIFALNVVSNIIGAISGLAGVLVGGEMYAIVEALAAASQKAGEVDASKLSNVAKAVNMLGTIFTGGTLTNIIGSVSGLFGAGVAAETAIIAGNMDSVMGSIQSMTHKLQEIGREYGGNFAQLKEDLDAIIATVKYIKDNFSTGLFDAIGAGNGASTVSSVASMAGSLDTTLGTIQSMCNKVKELKDQGYTKDDITTAVKNVRDVVWKLAEIDFSQSEDSLKSVSTKASSLTEMASSFDTILGTIQSICNKMKEFKEAGYTKEAAIEYVGNIKEVACKIAGIEFSQSEDTLSSLSSKASSIASAANSLNDILTALTTMVENIKNFNAAYTETTVSEQITTINKMLGDLLGDGEATGLNIPEISFTADDVTKLGHVSSALDKIKEIADKIANVANVSSELLNVEAVVKFIADTMSKVPENIAKFESDFQKQGEAYAQALINGWNSKSEDFTKMGKDAQGALWNAIEGKMSDEYWQGNALAQQVINGYRAKIDDGSFKNLGKNSVDGVYNGIIGNLSKIEWASIRLSQTAIDKIKEVLQIHSPSRVMAGFGGYIAEGLAEGIEDGLGEVENAGEKLAEAVMSGYNSTISPLDVASNEARAWSERERSNGSSTVNQSSIIQNNNIYNDLDMSSAMSNLAWAVSRS